MHVWDESPVLLFLKEGKEVDRVNVGNYDRIGMHALLESLGLKRDPGMTYEKKGKLKEMEAAFTNPDSFKGDL